MLGQSLSLCSASAGPFLRRHIFASLTPFHNYYGGDGFGVFLAVCSDGQRLVSVVLVSRFRDGFWPNHRRPFFMVLSGPFVEEYSVG